MMGIPIQSEYSKNASGFSSMKRSRYPIPSRIIAPPVCLGKFSLARALSQPCLHNCFPFLMRMPCPAFGRINIAWICRWFLPYNFNANACCNKTVSAFVCPAPALGAFFVRLPQCCKSRRASESRRQGCRRSKSTASHWQRRIWSPPAFPQGKKDGLN